MKRLFLLLTVISLILGACAKNEQTANHDDDNASVAETTSTTDNAGAESTTEATNS